jgi:hypothetical protein
MSPQLSLSFLPLPPPQPPLPSLSSSLLSLSAAVWHCHQAWRRCHQAWHCCQAWRRMVCADKLGVVLTPSVASLPSMASSSQSVELSPSISELSIVVTERALSCVASLPRLASSPERGVVLTERAPSGVALLLSGVTLLPKHGIVVIVAAIDRRVTTKRCFVGVGSASKGDSKREQSPSGRQ